MRSESAISTVRQWLTNPILCALLILLTGVDAYLAKGKGAQDPTVVGAFVHWNFPMSGGTPRPAYEAIAVVDDEGSVRLVGDVQSDRYLDALGEALRSGRPLLWLQYHTTGSSSGLWQYCSRERSHRLKALVHKEHDAWTPDRQSEAHRLLVAELVDGGWVPDELAATLLSGSASENEFFLKGLVHDLVASFLLVATLWSMGLNFRAHVGGRLRRRRDRVARGQRPFCGYDMRGIEGDVCPECGHALRAAPGEPPSA